MQSRIYVGILSIKKPENTLSPVYHNDIPSYSSQDGNRCVKEHKPSIVVPLLLCALGCSTFLIIVILPSATCSWIT